MHKLPKSDFVQIHRMVTKQKMVKNKFADFSSFSVCIIALVSVTKYTVCVIRQRLGVTQPQWWGVTEPIHLGRREWQKAIKFLFDICIDKKKMGEGSVPLTGFENAIVIVGIDQQRWRPSMRSYLLRQEHFGNWILSIFFFFVTALFYKFSVSFFMFPKKGTFLIPYWIKVVKQNQLLTDWVSRKNSNKNIM
jgi:hypothetical protein